MPIFVPILIGAAVATISGLGVKKSYDGITNMQRASEIAKSAGERHARATERLEEERTLTQTHAEHFADKKIAAMTGPIRDFLSLLEQLKQRGQLQGVVETLEALDIKPETLRGMRGAVVEAERLASGGMLAGAAGAAASKAALSLVGTYGFASTGAAITGLSGAAAKSATLAWLGGGSLAAGGWGMAGGAVVLGGIAVAPALAMGGFVLATQGERALTSATEYQAEVNVASQKMSQVQELLKRVQRRMDELASLIDGLARRATQAQEAINPSTFSARDPRHVEKFRTLVSLIRALSEVLRTPVLDEQGDLSQQGVQIQVKYRQLAGV